MLALVAFSSCSKDDDKDDTKPVDETLNTWQFTAGTQTYSGKIATAAFVNVISADLTMVGTFNDGGTDTIFTLLVPFSGKEIEPGSYNTTTGKGFSLSKMPSGDIIYGANFSSAPSDDRPGQVVTIKVNAYDSTTHVVTGTFDGQAYTIAEDGTEGAVPITNGSFKATVTKL